MKNTYLAVCVILLAISGCGNNDQSLSNKKASDDKKFNDDMKWNPPCHPNCPAAYYLNPKEYEKNHPEMFKDKSK